MTPANTLRLAGLAERAERIGCVLTDPGTIPEGLYTAAGQFVQIIPILPDELIDADDFAIAEYIQFTLESDSMMLDLVEIAIEMVATGRWKGESVPL